MTLTSIGSILESLLASPTHPSHIIADEEIDRKIMCFDRSASALDLEVAVEINLAGFEP
jgi:hypothetical protein